ncbi:hypothetical protein J7413_06670 [Shimia sp. R10_1]|uniref:hypothetical protein n=1 Tax=Shimia sp. R10_1 TaxID=2821095 RepID=UPI001ADA6B7C|nr:hypothetical protein [Shimia sp. R10_1]MBO9473219.1 hypothetical protein [Shimia sp. R10_1]
MQGWKLFKHAIGMIVRNWREAARIFLVLSLIGVVVLGLFVALMFTSMSHAGMAATPQLTRILMFLGVFVVTALLATWCVVAWHRFVMLEEMPQGWIPPFHKAQIFAYWGQIFKLSLAALLVVAPAGFVLMLIVKASPVLGVLIGIPAYFIAVLALMRLSVTLPAAAVGKPVTFSQAFEATTKSWGALLLMILLLAGLQILTQSAAAGLALVSPPLSVVLNLATTIFVSLLNISILTTLYGHYVEGRSID